MPTPNHIELDNPNVQKVVIKSNQDDNKDNLISWKLYKSEELYQNVTTPRIMCEGMGTFIYVYFVNFCWILYSLDQCSAASYALTTIMIIWLISTFGMDISGSIYNPAITV